MPATVEAFAILALLVAPGFVCWQFLGSNIPRVFVSDSHSILTSLIWSVIVHAVSSPYTIWMGNSIGSQWNSFSSLRDGDSAAIDWYVFLWLVAVLLVIPAVIALIVSVFWRAKNMQSFLSGINQSQVQKTPEAWDWFFLTQERGCWIVAEFLDGSYVGGEFGQNSFVSVSPHGKDLFLENEYTVDNELNFGEPVPDSVGTWINANQVKCLHFYRVEEEEA